MHRNLFSCAVMASLCLAMNSCEIEVIRPDTIPDDEEKVEVTFCADWAENTKSSLSVRVDAINNFKIAAYRGGRLDVSRYLSSGSRSASLEMVRNAEYAVYAIANAGDVTFPYKESDLSTFNIALSKISDLNTGIPMCWSDDSYKPKENDAVSLFFDRLVSELSFRLDPGAMDGLEVVSVRLMQGASYVIPFASGGSRVEGSMVSGRPIVMDGDYASKLDILALNSGKPITLFTLENRQGNLLPSNRDPMRKIPDNLSHPERCTYLEVLCRFTDESVMEGTVTYRLYPGEDDCSNFDLVRNHIYDLTLMLTPGGLREVSWRVENKASYKLSLGVWKIVKGMHEADDLYIGEKTRIQVALHSGLAKMLSGSLQDCSLRLVRAGVPSDDVSFGEISVESDNIITCDMKGEKESLAVGNTLYLYGPDGKPVSDLTHESLRTLAVRKPRIAVLDQVMKRPVVNGEPALIDVTLVDRNGLNLNSSASYGFDISKYSDIVTEITERTVCSSENLFVDSAIRACTASKTKMGTECSGGPAATIESSMVNLGKSEALNRELSRLYGRFAANDAAVFDCSIRSANAEPLTIPMSFDIVPVEIWHCSEFTDIEGYNRSYDQDEFDDYRLVVSNPSNITLEGSVIYTGWHHQSLSPLRQCSDVTFITGDSSIPSDLVGSMTDFLLEPSRTDDYDSGILVDPETGERRKMNTYHVQRNLGYRMSSPYAMYLAVMSYMNYNWQQCIGDVLIKTVGGYPVGFLYKDFYNSVTSSDKEAIDKIRYYSSRAWHPDGNRVWEGVSRYNVLANSTWDDLAAVHRADPIEFALEWKENIGYVLNVNGDQTARKVGITVTAECRYLSSLIWRSNRNGLPVNESYTKTTTATYVLQPGVNMMNVMTRYGFESAFYSLNTEYWHQSCDALTARRSNVYAVFAMPESVEMTVTLKPNDNSWLPVTLRAGRGVTDMETITLYSRTSEGTYPVHSDLKNPDGSSRGTIEANAQAVRFADYTVAEDAGYSFSASLVGGKSFHRYNR
ncbi:MAG: DUF4906 domain-containing protein [Bacteroidales bacterium]|nr:DUF4906 domain-containing protein [Candidatus Cryptobacteroides caccocaballi]